MKRVFSSIEISEAVLVRDALLRQNIEATIENQYAGTVIPAFRPPAEVWIGNDADFQSAREIVKATIARLDSTANDQWWPCAHCKEQNPESFEVCWNCGSAR